MLRAQGRTVHDLAGLQARPLARRTGASGLTASLPPLPRAAHVGELPVRQLGGSCQKGRCGCWAAKTPDVCSGLLHQGCAIETNSHGRFPAAQSCGLTRESSQESKTMGTLGRPVLPTWNLRSGPCSNPRTLAAPRGPQAGWSFVRPQAGLAGAFPRPVDGDFTSQGCTAGQGAGPRLRVQVGVPYWRARGLRQAQQGRSQGGC